MLSRMHTVVSPQEVRGPLEHRCYPVSRTRPVVFPQEVRGPLDVIPHTPGGFDRTQTLGDDPPHNLENYV